MIKEQEFQPIAGCLVCQEQTSISKLKCKCKICDKCLFTWTIQQINQNKKVIKCLNEYCEEEYMLEEIIEQQIFTDKLFLNQFESLFLKKILLSDQSIINCTNCDNFMFLDKECLRLSQFECNNCNIIFKSQGDETFKQFLLNFLTILYNCRACPKCNVKILKKGGCNHIVCWQCQYEFCWKCNQQYFFHNDFTCISNGLTKFFIILYLSFCVCFLFGISESIIKNISNIITLVQQCLAYNFLAVLIIYWCFTLSLIVNAKEKAESRGRGISYQQKLQKQATQISIYLFIIIAIYQQVLQYYGSGFISPFIYLLIEIIIFACSYAGYFFLSYGYDTWLKYVI